MKWWYMVKPYIMPMYYYVVVVNNIHNKQALQVFSGCEWVSEWVSEGASESCSWRWSLDSTWFSFDSFLVNRYRFFFLAPLKSRRDTHDSIPSFLHDEKAVELLSTLFSDYYCCMCGASVILYKNGPELAKRSNWWSWLDWGCAVVQRRIKSKKVWESFFPSFDGWVNK